MWFSKATIHRAIHLMHASQFAICHQAPNIFPSAPMFQAQQVSNKKLQSKHQAARNVTRSPGASINTSICHG